ncbi:MAG: Ribosomal-protein-S5p-alanine acetyltransferase [Chloroflexi bacterium AL-W]|nr:Ribosomal-protein-S5p-alanine acetyltransferase [Chloroflexi bacterium AL-N1]NOK67354.1 Ribosomal-protein-S5p-alanine acetyltransferase [Chloroflexi bacterium AL-N10]NOK75154.1 Ribosomal-protein-S5p-alanine acetyltransferase [Chloroflexi bacterium AL-N5]NOK81942.1 Ribosomal-protein-S5p-alanine acetyltransferase [Chloroflexi bacterium AL-W]NOK89787.1 Ribosomal-protein-S5p-alanine acetyltransferase [Chloroflexi bacterium AL-N15]
MLQPNLLAGANVQLTALMNADITTIARWYRDDEFARLLDALPARPQTETDLTQWIESQHKENNTFLLAIRLIDTEDIIGFTEIDGILWNHQTGWITIAIGDIAYRGKGYGTEALQLVLSFAFRELNLYRVQLTVFSYNERAIALYEQAGFQREGTYREYIHRDGTRYDMHLYGLLRSEWETNQNLSKRRNGS